MAFYTSSSQNTQTSWYNDVETIKKYSSDKDDDDMILKKIQLNSAKFNPKTKELLQKLNLSNDPLLYSFFLKKTLSKRISQ